MNVGLGLAVALAAAGCATEFTPTRCAVDSDCASGSVCEERDGQAVCVLVDDAPLVIGQSAPITGTNQSLGTQLKLGIELALAEQNALGGVRGRRLELAFRDDASQPHLAEAAARALVDAQASLSDPPKCPSTTMPTPGQAPVSSVALSRGPGAVLAMLGNVGTPAIVRAAPIAVETGTVYFGAITGEATLVRDMQSGPCARYMFTMRASHAEEARATLELFRKRGVPSYRHLISFDQLDSLGQAGYDGLVTAYHELYGAFPAGADPTNPIPRFRYARNDDLSARSQAIAAQNYLAQLLAGQTGTVRVGIQITGSFGATSEFIAALRTWQFADDAQQQSLEKATRLDLAFSALSVVGANALAERLVAAGSVDTPSGPRSLADGVVISQVVPNYQDDASEVIADYNRAIASERETPSFASLETYVTARVLVAGLVEHRGPFTSEKLLRTLERLPPLALGLGASAGFSPINHHYSSSVWGTALRGDGTFANLYFWSEGTPIQFFE